MAINYARIFNHRATPQSQPIPGSSQVRNSGGGYSWQVDDWTRLDRFLMRVRRVSNLGGLQDPLEGGRNTRHINAARVASATTVAVSPRSSAFFCIRSRIHGDVRCVLHCAHERSTGLRSGIQLARVDPRLLGPCGRNESPSVCRFVFPAGSREPAEPRRVNPRQRRCGASL